ncbi:MAG: TraB/VirB10 family protein [Deltaproteobacteria bacterium]|nr:TraB/VirB10 family protein [Deltaproteobacteria bacterium]
MDLKQKLNDAKLIIKSDRRVWAIGGVIVLIVLMIASSGDRTRRGRGRAQEQKGASQMTDQGEAYKDLVKSLQADLANVAGASREIKDSTDRLKRDFQSYRSETEGLFQIFGDRVEGLYEEQKALKASMEERAARGGEEVAAVDTEQLEEPTTVGSFGFEESTVPPPPPPPPPAPGRSTFISPGDIVPVRLLTGVAAPTDGTPYPVVFQFKGPVNGPDGSSLDLGEARLIAAAQGSETDGRVIYRLTDLAIRHSSGRRSVVKVDGWVVGEDGVRGMRGKVIDKLGQLILATMGYSFAAALGERVDDKSNRLRINNSRNISVTPQDFDVATASALTDASNRLGQLLVDKYEKQIPVVEVLAGREAAAVFSKGAEVSMIEEDEDGEGVYAASSSLD